MTSEPDTGATNAGTETDESRENKDGDDRHKNDPRRSGMPKLTVRVPKGLESAVDDAIDEGHYSSRSDAVRFALRQQFGRGGA